MFHSQKLFVVLSIFCVVVCCAFLVPRRAKAVTFSSIPSINIPTNGTINSIVSANGFAYVGGNFTRIGQSQGSFVPLDLSAGNTTGTFPQVNGSVSASVADGFGGYYIGGLFTQVGSSTISNLAHILPNGTVDPLWTPNPSLVVSALALSASSTLYAGGNFTTIGGQTRNRIAEISLATGLATSWDPNANINITGLVLSTATSTIYAVGNFTTIGGQTRNRIAEISLITASSTSWNPNSSATINSLALSSASSTIYVGGYFTTIGGQTRNRIAEISLATGLATSWNPGSSASVSTLVLSASSTLYAGGLFTTIGGQPRNFIAELSRSTGLATSWNPNADTAVNALVLSASSTIFAGGFFTVIGGQARNRIAEINLATGLATSWNPNVSATVNTLTLAANAIYLGATAPLYVGSQTDLNNIFQVNLTTGAATSWNPNANGSVLALALSASSTLYAGGNFTTIGGQTRNRIAEISLATGLATSWNPSSSAAINSLALSAASSTIYAGGTFATIGGQTRNRIAEISLATGLATSWDPNSNNTVNVLALSSASSTIYAGGSFTTIGGQTRSRIAEINLSTASSTAWNPGLSSTLNSLALFSASSSYVGGAFTTIGGQARTRVAEISLSTASSTSWNPTANNVVLALATNSNQSIFAGGAFATIGGQTRANIAEIDLVTGLATSWNNTATIGSVNTITNDPSFGILAGGTNFLIFPATLTPENPRSLSVTRSLGQIALSWVSPLDNGTSAVTGYIVQYKLSSASIYAVFTTTNASTTAATVNGLTNGLSYDFQVLAQNSGGTSSPASISATPSTVPDAPTSVVAIPGSGYSSVSFNPPTSNGFSAITGYTVTSNPGGFTATGGISPIVVFGLTNGVSYTFTVTATNINGASFASSISNAVVPSNGTVSGGGSASWYDTLWTKRQVDTIGGSTAGAQTNYPVKIVVTYAPEMKADFSDVRFTDLDGTTLLNFWLESKTDGVSATFWVKAPSIPTGPAATNIYMYYGNPAATSTSNGNGTFSLFDTFGSGATPGDWNYSYNTIGEHATIKNGKLYAPLEDSGLTYSGLVILNASNGAVIKHFSMPTTNCLEAAPAIDKNGFIHAYACSGFLAKINEASGVVAQLNISNPVDWEAVPYDSINDNILIVVGGTGLRAVKATDYTTAWTNSNVSTTGAAINGPPLLVGSFAYWQDYSGKLFKISLVDGSTVASTTAISSGSIDSYAQLIYDSANSRIYATNSTGHTAYAVNASDLSVIWSKSIESTGWKIFRGGAYHNNVLYVNIRQASGPFASKLYALDTQNNGNILWTNTTPFDNTAQASSVLVDDNYAYETTYDYAHQTYNKLLVINIADGSVAENIALLNGVASSIPTFYGGKIIIGLWDLFGYQAVQVRDGGGTGDFFYKADSNMTGYVGASSAGPLTARTICDYPVLDGTKWTSFGFTAITNCSSISTINSFDINRHFDSKSLFSRAGTAIRVRSKNAEAVGNAFDTYLGYGNGIITRVGSAVPIDSGENNGHITFTYDQNGAPQTTTGPVYSQNQYNTTEIKMAYPSLQFDVNDINIASTTGWSTIYNNAPIQLGNNRGVANVDWALVRSYAFPEPAVSLGAVASLPVAPSGGSGTPGGVGGVPPPVTVTPTSTVPTAVTPPSPAATSTNPNIAVPAGGIPFPGLSQPGIPGNAVRLVNDNGTYFLIVNGVKFGITDPGILNSYGFGFNDAAIATPQDIASLLGSILTPADGALVKSKQDPTVYLISNQQRYGFTSAKVFTALGFKFSSVLTITSPELGALPLAVNLSDPNAAHLPGVSINSKGTVYRIGSDNLRHPYPSLAIYNSWNIDNNFSTVVPANTADLLIPVGEAVVGRVTN